MTTEHSLSDYLHNCLYFTAGTLARVVARMADKAFRDTGLSPSHAFLLMLAIERPGLTHTELAEALHLAPSTMTRFVDKLERAGLVEREAQGKLSRVSATDAGLALRGPIAQAWKRLYRDYSDILGEEAGRELTAQVDRAGMRLEERG